MAKDGVDLQSQADGYGQRVPNKPKTPLRSLRISDELWQAAQAKAAERGESVSDVVRRSLERYVRSK